MKRPTKGTKRLLALSVFLVLAAIFVLGLRIAYPAHRTLALILLGLSWLPLFVSYRRNALAMSAGKQRIREKARPFIPHMVVGGILLLVFYVVWQLFPVYESPLADMKPDELREEIKADLDTYLILRRSIDDALEQARDQCLLECDVKTLSMEKREAIRSLWRDMVMLFLEFDMLKEKYRGFYQIDYVSEPELHSDAFMLAYMAYVGQYDACLQVVEMVENSEFLDDLLNEEGQGVPEESYYTMKQHLTKSRVMIRMNAGAAYYQLVKGSTTIDPEIVEDFRTRRDRFYKGLGKKLELFAKNPLDRLERTAFETMLPIQKKVAVQMSYIRMTNRDYLITPQMIGRYKDRFEPGDIMVQRRNWHMTNIGIPGFWPHAALYVGTPAELEAYFSELDIDPLKTLQEHAPIAYSVLLKNDADGYPMRVIESIRPGVVLQSLETSTRCDYLGVIRPNLSKKDKFKALLEALEQYGKPYDLNFDFATDNEQVCSELVYKAYKCSPLPLEPIVSSGRLMLAPNELARQASANMGPEAAFSFVLFLDAVEKDDTIVECDERAFQESVNRPKWDIMQR
ncbi:MAG: hypothetical protein JXR40_06520 [Pontiellaceae bacterium]|nr:hypothetical protein [Pontiellaceae bacterium]